MAGFNVLNIIKRKIKDPGSVVGLHVTLGTAKNIYRLCHLSLKKDYVQIINLTQVEGLADISNYISGKFPVALVIQGKGILTKKVAFKKSEEQNNFELIQEAWPTISIKEFQFQEYVTENGKFISLIRQDLLSGLIKELFQNGITVIDVKLGIFPVSNVFPFITNLPSELVLEGEQITIEQNQIIAIRPIQIEQPIQSLTIGNDTVEAKWLLSYSVALNTLALNSSNPLMVTGPTKKNRDEWEQKQIFKIAGLGFLGITLAFLFSNYLIFSFYLNQNQLLANQASESLRELDYLNALNNQVAAQEVFLKGSGWIQPIKNSFYLDRFAATVPKQITLTYLALHPVNEKSSKQEKKIVLKPGVLVVKGRCVNSQPVNLWIQQISNLDWAKNVKGQRYNYDSNRGVGVFEFEIVLAN